MLENLKKLRNEFAISQKAMAEILGVSQQTISNYENGNVEPDIALLSRLAAYFDTTIDYIVGRTEIRNRAEFIGERDLNEQEAEVVGRYRLLGEKEKACIDLILQKFSEK